MASIIKSDTKAKSIQAAAKKKVAAKKPVVKKKPVVVAKPQAVKKYGVTDSGTGVSKPVVTPPIESAAVDERYANRPVLTEAQKVAGAKVQTTPATPYQTQQPLTAGQQLQQDTMNAKMEGLDSGVLSPSSIETSGVAPGDDRYANRPPLSSGIQPTVTPSVELAEAEERYKDRPDLTPDQKFAFKIQEDQVVEQKTTNTVDQIDKSVGGATNDLATQPTTVMPSGKTATTTAGGTGVVPVVEEPDLTEVEPGAPPSTENKYVDQLTEMKFEYDPFSDPDYRETAANLENQVAQMMIGRGGLYSSVAASALSAKLISLQNDMSNQAYDRFRQDRDFTLQMAKFTEDQINAAWNRNMTEKKFAADRADTKWSQDFQQKQFDFSQVKEAFDQKMAMANYNLSAQAQSFSQSMRIKEYNLSVANANAQRQQAAAEAQLGQQRLLVQGNAVASQLEREKYNRLYSEWKDTGKASSEVSRYFGVPTGATMGAFGMKIVNKDNYLRQTESQIIADAYQLEMDKTYLDTINQTLSTSYLKPVVKEVPEVNISTRTSYDETGALTGTTTTKTTKQPVTADTGPRTYKPMDYSWSDK